MTSRQYLYVASSGLRHYELSGTDYGAQWSA